MHNRRPDGLESRKEDVHLNMRNRTNDRLQLFRAEAGFSAVELVVVIAIAITLSAIAVVAFQPALKNAQGDAAMRQTLDAIRQARQYAITNRRYVQLTFSTGSPATITATQRNDIPITAGFGTTNPVLFTISIEGPGTFYLANTTPDTPDAFGKCAPICIENTSGGPTSIFFQSDGEFVDGTYNSMNGSLFLGSSGVPTSYRAVSVMGSTGRVRAWKYNGAAWSQQ
jgi:type II secretory pathway pseudopilin PulG